MQSRVGKTCATFEDNKLLLEFIHEKRRYSCQQAGTDPSRRHIQDSKLAKGLQSVKVFSSQYLKNPKNWTELARNFEKKSHIAEKKLKGGPFSLSRYCMIRGKRGKTFLVQFARPNDSIWDHKIS